MKPLRVAVVVVLLAVIAAGVLGTPWVQVVEKHSRTDEIPYTIARPYTYSVTENLSSTLTATATVLQRSYQFFANQMVLPDLMIDAGKVVRIEVVRIGEPIKPIEIEGWLVRLATPEDVAQGFLPAPIPVCIGFNLTGTGVFDGVSMGDGPPCTVPKSNAYFLILDSLTDYEPSLEINILVESTTYSYSVVTVVNTATTTFIQTSTLTTTWYNTTYQRPLG